MSDVLVTCKVCSDSFSVPLVVLESRDIDTCVRCFRTSSALVLHSAPPQIFRPDHIDMNIFLGGYRCAMDRKVLSDSNITRVIICGNDLRQYFPEDVEYLQFPLEDEHDQNISVFFDQAHEFIRTAPSNVLVHCHAGVSRSATIVLSYLMKVKAMSVAEARLFVKQKRRCICPNPGFMKQLEEYHVLLQAKPQEATAPLLHES